jgi:hypothetical protein
MAARGSGRVTLAQATAGAAGAGRPHPGSGLAGDRKAMTAGVGADLDEGPDSFAAHRDLVEAALEVDRDRTAAGGAAEGKEGIVDLPAGLHGT